MEVDPLADPLKMAAQRYLEAWGEFSRAVRNSGDDELLRTWEAVDWQSAREPRLIASEIVNGSYD